MKKKTEHVTRCRWLLRIYFVESAKYSFLQIFYLNRWYQNERLLIENCPKFCTNSRSFPSHIANTYRENTENCLCISILKCIYITTGNMMNDASWLPRLHLRQYGWKCIKIHRRCLY